MPDLDNFANLCMGCTQEKTVNKICPKCEFDENTYEITKQLPIRFLLQNRYIVGKQVDDNGEGIGYIGYDTVIKSSVYIREFMPDNLCQRNHETDKIKIIPGCEIVFKENLKNFLDYFRTFAMLRDVRAFIPVFDIFEENNTAYTVSEWVENITLKEFVKRSGKKLTWSVARPLFMPVLSSLIEMKKAGIHHLAINPENLIVLRRGKMKLKGFAVPAIRQVDTDLQPELYDGCSAIEQYVGSAELGEYTDVYGFTASLFFAITSDLPLNAVKRKSDERLLIPKSVLKVIPPHIITALADGLQVSPRRRIADFKILQDDLSASPSISKVMEDIVISEEEEKKKKEAPKKKKNILICIISCFIALVLFALAAFFLTNNNSSINFFSKSVSSSVVSSKIPSIVSSSSVSSSTTYGIPNLVGKNYEKSKQEASKDGHYEVVMSSEEFNDNVVLGSIISQSPVYSEDSKINSGTVIAVVVSKGSKYKELPNISGLTLSQASAKITEVGLVPQKGTEEYSSIYEEGTVIGYISNKPGDILEYGSTVKLVISKGIA